VEDCKKYPLNDTLDESDDGFLITSTWERDLLPYLAGSKKLFTDPGVTEIEIGWRGVQPDVWDVPWHNWCYGYNTAGTDPDERPALGLGIMSAKNAAVPDSRVLVPVDMLAVADGLLDYGVVIIGFGYPGSPWDSHLNSRDNGLFCDGHVESGSSRWFPTNDASECLPDGRTKLWNNDNQPHMETWQAP
jgi:hypothetical protein